MPPVRCRHRGEASLQKGRLIKSNIAARLSGCVFAIVDGEEHVLTGESAEEVRKLFRPAIASPGRQNALHGTVACRGKVAGPCRVIIRADDFQGELPKGTIVVSESTDPDMLRFLRAAGGVLTEQGGVTSHAAIICRELGIPTIIGIEGLLERVRDGDWVELDAQRGIVTVSPSRQPAHAALAAVAPEHSPDVIGAKAYNLGIVRSSGFHVPEYVVLKYDSVRRITGCTRGGVGGRLVQRVIEGLGLTNGDKLVVRSSAIAEDRQDSSCAGAYRSLLDVAKHQLAEALGDFVKSNRAIPGRPNYRGSVIVQRMIQADCSGVCLTRDGRTGNGDAVIVEMTAGGNTGVTGGTVRPDRFVVDRLTCDILQEHRQCALLRARAIDVTGLVQQFLKLESKFDQPLDIEWALAGEKRYILQARPIVGGPSAVPFVGVWNSIAGPATLRVVGDTLTEHRRSMAFSLQSIQKRLSSLLAYFASGQLVLWLGQIQGVRAALCLSIVLVAISWLVQYRYMRTAVSDQVRAHHNPLALLRRLDPQLRRLLVSETCVRWCDSMPRELIILYCVPILAPLLRTSATQSHAELSVVAVAFYIGVLLVVMNVTSLLLYLPVGHFASKGGTAKKPFIGMTFVFFALFPASLILLGGLGVWGMVLAFVICGLREFGEPARKAMITELVPPDCRTQAIGIYWSARCAGVVPASMIGGLLWYFAGPQTMLWCATAIGMLGAALFYLRFAGNSPPIE